ncbi:hypothetical protein KC19_11G039700 [Ceratodon purpureus]|uniref:Uncharacterized protein n=1 Tax=Ceratodon purpureus TaxID=3225 RepID=A0A8T0GCN8_CERPU|nr:hypothetical protein KC19_11G039700 [Ceratodon purpureus]
MIIIHPFSNVVQRVESFSHILFVSLVLISWNLLVVRCFIHRFRLAISEDDRCGSPCQYGLRHPRTCGNIRSLKANFGMPAEVVTSLSNMIYSFSIVRICTF